MIDPGQIKALFFDIDGTLARSDTHTIPQSHVESFRLLHEKGYQLFIATGRDLYIHEEEQILDPVMPYLTGFVDVNGQHCALADGTEISLHPIHNDDFLPLRKTCEEHHLAMLYRVGHVNHLTELTFRVKRYWEKMGIGIPEIRPMDPGIIDIPKLCIHASPEDEARWLAPHMKHTWTARITEDLIDLIPNGVGKSTGMRDVCAYLGIPIEQTMAFGDGQNDLDLMEAAGIAVAMENGAENVKALADFVTLPPEQGGITHALKLFGLI